MNNKKDFKLNSDARKKINEQYFSEPSPPPVIPQRERPRDKAKPDPRSRRASPPMQQSDPFGGQRPYTEPPQKSVKRQKSRIQQAYETEEIVIEERPLPKKKHPKLRRFIIKTLIFCLVVILLNIAFLYYRGHLWFNEPRKRDYPVRGAVIDSELGKVDWEVMKTQTISFVYIRATKGTVFVDEQYSANRKSVNNTGLLSGYYHEFDFSTDGEKQAENFIENLGSLDGRLRPMVRVTRYGIYYIHMKDKDKAVENLRSFLDRVEQEYGRRCVIMCDKACYDEYIKESFPKYTLWLMGHFREPDEEDTHWALWEFNPRVRSAGYENKKKYYAISVYRKERDIENFKKNFIM